MRAMIFGDTASGKSTFANELGAITATPVIHLDEIMESLGRDQRESISSAIHYEADKPAWVIEGNAFTKDKTYRIDRAECVFAFDFDPIQTLANHVTRYSRLKSGVETRVGSANQDLNLDYFIPYIFKKFPPRKRAAIDYAKETGKDLTVFNSRAQATAYLLALTVDR